MFYIEKYGLKSFQVNKGSNFMLICKYCNEEISATSKECPHCGKKLSKRDILRRKKDKTLNINAKYALILTGLMMSIIAYLVAPIVNPYLKIIALFMFIFSLLMAIFQYA